MSNFIPWLRGLAEKGGKGVVNNIDARCLGRIADELERSSADSAKWFDECGKAYSRAHEAEAALDEWVRQAEDNSGGWQRCQLELEATKERLASAMEVLRSIFDPNAPDDALSKAAQKFVDDSSDHVGSPRGQT